MTDRADSVDLYNGNILRGKVEGRGPGKVIYLVTGANRGIGKTLVALLLQRTDTIVIACVRSVSASEAQLQEIPVATGSHVIVLELDCAKAHAAQLAVDELQSVHAISYIDIVIANAGIAADYTPASALQLDHLQNHMMVNTYAVLLLFQATMPLLQQAGPGRAKFVLIGAQLGSITNMDRFGRSPLAAYSVSKLAANYLVRRFHFENDWLISFSVDPGYVQTDMGNRGARLMGAEKAKQTIEDSVMGISARIDEATKQDTSGQFINWQDGSRVAW